MRLFVKSILTISTIAVIAGAADAQFSKPDDAIRYRKAVMVLTVHHFKQMGAMVQGKVVYDRVSFQEQAKLVNILSTLPWAAFMTAGSDKGNTGLKPSALKNQTAFMQAAKTFEDAAKGLEQASDSGDLGTIKTRFGQTAKSCKGCHGQFRK
jgi:cytochrome c556